MAPIATSAEIGFATLPLFINDSLAFKLDCLPIPTSKFLLFFLLFFFFRRVYVYEISDISRSLVDFSVNLWTFWEDTQRIEHRICHHVVPLSDSMVDFRTILRFQRADTVESNNQTIEFSSFKSIRPFWVFPCLYFA